MRTEIPDEMARRIEALDDSHGYHTVGEFVRETVRQRLEYLENQSGDQTWPATNSPDKSDKPVE